MFYNRETQKYANMLPAYAAGRNKLYSSYKVLFNIPIKYTTNMRSALSRFVKNAHVSSYGTSEMINSLSVANVPEISENDTLSAATINKGFTNGYEAVSDIEKCDDNSLTKLLDETVPDILEPVLPEYTSYVGTLFSGTYQSTILGSDLSNGGIIGGQLPVFIIVDDSTKLFKMDNGIISPTTIYINGRSDNDSSLSETITIDRPGVFRTQHDYGVIESISVDAQDADFSFTLTTDPLTARAMEPFYLFYSPDRNAFPYWYAVDTVNNQILLQHYVANTPEKFMALGAAIETEEYITIVDSDGVPIADAIEQVVPSEYNKYLYVKAGNYLYVISKNKHLPGTLEQRNILKTVAENSSYAPLIKIHPRRESYNSYNIDVYYYRDKPDTKITAYKIILHTADGKTYYYDQATNGFVETDQPENSLPFNPYATGEARGFYLKDITIENLPVGDNYVDVIYLTDKKEEGRYYEFLPVEYRIALAKILIQDDNVDRPYGPYTKFAMNSAGAFLCYNDTDSISDASTFNQPYDSNHSLNQRPGCSAVVLPARLTHTKYIIDASTNSVYLAAKAADITINGKTYISYPHKILTYLDELGTIWQLSRNEGEYFVTYAKRLYDLVSRQGVGSQTKQLVAFLCNKAGVKQMKSFTIRHPSYPDGIASIEHGVFSFYENGEKYIEYEAVDTHDLFQYSTIQEALDALTDDGYTVTILDDRYLGLSPAAIVDGANVQEVQHEIMSLGYRHQFGRKPVVPETVIAYSTGLWISSFNVYSYRYGTNAIAPHLVYTEDEFNNADGYVLWIDAANNQIISNYNIDEVVFLDYAVRDDSGFVISPIFVTDLSKAKERRSLMNNDYAPRPENDDVFINAGHQNIIRWG